MESVNELNTVLNGEYMAIHAYEQFLEKVEDPEIKKALQKIQQDHKLHAMKIAERIQNLGGQPVDGTGLMGEIMLEIKGLQNKDTLSILKDAFTGEQQGIEMSAEIVKGNLDSESMALVNRIFKQDEEHLLALLDLMNI